jgi:2,3-bisphosphoglycerate-independent phosphoglycerate mutase
MIDPLTGEPHTQHTTYPVPCMVMDQDNWKLSCQGGLSSVAPTVLELMGIPRPECMTSASILLQSRKRVPRPRLEVKLKGVA